jgi:hypothetical protein
MARIRTPVNQTIFVKPHVQALANALEAEFGLTNFGTYLGHSPPEGPTQALDIFTPDNASGWALQDRVCTWLRENAKRFGCRYHIRRIQIWNIERAAEGYRNQTRTGNRTADHMDHIHDTQYAWAPGPFDQTPTPPANLQGEDMLILNVKKLGIFMLRGDNISHMQHPDHVLEWVRAGVTYQDRVEMSWQVFTAYTGYDPGIIQGLLGVSSAANLDAVPVEIENAYNDMLSEVRTGIEQMKEEYYAMMTSGE